MMRKQSICDLLENQYFEAMPTSERRAILEEMADVELRFNDSMEFLDSPKYSSDEESDGGSPIKSSPRASPRGSPRWSPTAPGKNGPKVWINPRSEESYRRKGTVLSVDNKSGQLTIRVGRETITKHAADVVQMTRIKLMKWPSPGCPVHQQPFIESTPICHIPNFTEVDVSSTANNFHCLADGTGWIPSMTPDNAKGYMVVPSEFFERLEELGLSTSRDNHLESLEEESARTELLRMDASIRNKAHQEVGKEAWGSIKWTDRLVAARSVRERHASSDDDNVSGEGSSVSASSPRGLSDKAVVAESPVSAHNTAPQPATAKPPPTSTFKATAPAPALEAPAVPAPPIIHVTERASEVPKAAAPTPEAARLASKAALEPNGLESTATEPEKPVPTIFFHKRVGNPRTTNLNSTVPTLSAQDLLGDREPALRPAPATARGRTGKSALSRGHDRPRTPKTSRSASTATHNPVRRQTSPGPQTARQTSPGPRRTSSPTTAASAYRRVSSAERERRARVQNTYIGMSTGKFIENYECPLKKPTQKKVPQGAVRKLSPPKKKGAPAVLAPKSPVSVPVRKTSPVKKKKAVPTIAPARKGLDPNVKAWLIQNGHSKYIDNFTKAKVTSSTLPYLTRPQLTSMGIPTSTQFTLISLLPTPLVSF